MLEFLIILGVLGIIGLVTYLSYKLIKGLLLGKRADKVRNFAADNPQLLSKAGPWGTAVSGIAKFKGYGTE